LQSNPEGKIQEDWSQLDGMFEHAWYIIFLSKL